MKIKLSQLLVLTFVFISMNVTGQIDECNFESYLEYQVEIDPERRQKRMQFDKDVDLKQVQTRNAAIDIPIKAYILRQSNGTGGIAECDLSDALAVANVQFLPAMFNLVICELEYIDSDAYYNIGTFSEGDNLYNSNNNPNAMNIYFVNSAAGYCGWANLPSDPDLYIMMDNSCTMNTSTFAHEIGHYLGLYHTHQGGNELVNGTNCSTAGDLLCDTPADPTLSGLVNTSCQYLGSATDANGDLYVPDPLNMMSYSQKHCRDIFSSDQSARMNFFYNSVRAAQLTCSGTVNLCCADGDADGDGVCDGVDQCPGFNDNLIGTACEDGDVCTTGETYDTSCTCSGGTSADSDADGVCDALDLCPGFDDTIDSDGDGIPDGCDPNCTQQIGSFPISTLNHSGTGSSISTFNFNGTGLDATFSVTGINQKQNGNASKKYIEQVEVSYINAIGNTIIYGTYSGANVSSVNVNIPEAIVSVTVTLSDIFDGNGPNGMSVTIGTVDFCGAECDDADGDGVCDAEDQCPGFDDTIDTDGDGIPDGCDNCTSQSVSFNPDPLNHSGTGSSSSTVIISSGVDISLTVSGMGSKINGSPSKRYTDVVSISYTDGTGSNVSYGTFSGDQQSSVNVSIAGVVLDVTVSLSDGYDGNADNISVDLSLVDYCPSGADENTGDLIEKKVFAVSMYPNPASEMLTIDINTQSCNVKMYNIKGELVNSFTQEGGRAEIDLVNYAPGLYMFLFESDGDIKTERLIKL